MSKFIGRLAQASQIAPQPIGFRAAQAASPKHRILLVAAVASSDAAALADYVAGADAGLLRISKIGSGSDVLGKVMAATPDIPWGIWLEESVQKGLKKATKLDSDFIVFSAGAALATPADDDATGIIIQLETSTAEGPLRTVNELPVDAVLVASQAEKGGQLTWYQLMLLQRFADLVTKPMLASIPDGVGDDELQFLWEAGIDGVVVETGPDHPPGEVTRLRQVIDGLELPTTRKRQKIDALLPRAERDAEVAVDIEEEEDE